MLKLSGAKQTVHEYKRAEGREEGKMGAGLPNGRGKRMPFVSSLPVEIKFQCILKPFSSQIKFASEPRETKGLAQSLILQWN